MRVGAVKPAKTSPNNDEEQNRPQNDKKIETCVDQTPPLWFSKRFLVSVVIFFAYINIGIILTNINIAVVEMTSAKLITKGNSTILRPAEFQWDPSFVGIVSSSISYGGLFALGGGFFVDKMGGAGSFAFIMMMCGVLNILHPVSLYLDIRLFFLFRLLTGFFGNCFYASVAEIYSRWFPKKERPMLIAFCCVGTSVGVTVMNPLFGFIADRVGWQMVFYVTGLLSLVSALLCLIVVRNRPSQDKLISQEELNYILEETYDVPRKRISHPYKTIFLSPPVWALCFVDFTLFWTNNVDAGCLPLYAKDLTGRTTDEIGYLCSIPLIVTIILYPVAGILINRWKNHTSIDETRMDKIIISVTFLSASMLYAACGIFSNFTASMVLLVMIESVKSFVPPVLEPNIVNLAPNDSSIVAGLTKICTSLSTIFSRTIFGFMTMNHTIQEWNNCFFFTSGILIIGAAIFAKYGSSEAQPWSVPSIDEDEDDERDFLIKTKNQDQK
ncbi:vesicular glutamate transporter 1-like [Planococcus citri]|uniref:vesicular glutamate transporter 1-like n=1 Tax=Planococcus citri TaxID=170843 RepID=UPI0031F9119E